MALDERCSPRYTHSWSYEFREPSASSPGHPLAGRLCRRFRVRAQNGLGNVVDQYDYGLWGAARAT